MNCCRSVTGGRWRDCSQCCCCSGGVKCRGATVRSLLSQIAAGRGPRPSCQEELHKEKRGLETIVATVLPE